MASQGNRYITKRNIAYVAGSLLIGALGSGVWEALMRPALSWAAEGALNIATLGLTSLQDGMYVEVARGGYDRVGLGLLSLATGLLTALFFLPPMYFHARRRDKADALAGKPPSWVVRNKVLVLTIYGAVFGAFIFISTSRVTYVVRAAAHLDQLQSIVAPDIGEHERLVFRSRASQVKNRDDYVLLERELTALARHNGHAVPSFDVF